MATSKYLQYVQEAIDIQERASGRDMTPEEFAEASVALDKADAASTGEKTSQLMRKLGPTGDVASQVSPMWTSAGKAFVNSAEYKKISDPAGRGQSFSTGPVPVSFESKAGTTIESGQGAGLIPVPQVLPGVVQKLFQPIQVTQLFGSFQANNNQVRYAVEGTATSGAAGVAEGGTKPPSDLAYSTVDEQVRKIATTITLSDEILDDAEAVQQFISSRLTLFVSLEEERQLLRGGGTNELVGLIGRSGVNTYSRGSDDNVVALAKVVANTQGSANVPPTGIILHPQNWLATRLLKDGVGGTAGNFYGSGPFGQAAQNAGAAGLFGQTLWDLPVALSTTVGVGTAVVGAFATDAAIGRRGGPTVEASNSHQDYFQKDLVMLRAEQREALAVYRPNAFTVVSGLS
jgi:HK97 family phage major capsid protein